jgi:hypothetical protein
MHSSILDANSGLAYLPGQTSYQDQSKWVFGDYILLDRLGAHSGTLYLRNRFEAQE